MLVKKTLNVIIPITFLVFLNCATAFTLKLVEPVNEDNKIKKFYFDGKEIAVSIGKESIVGLYGYKEKNQDLVLFVFCKNLSKDKNINFFPEKIKAIGYNKYNKEISFKTYSPDEYLKKIRSKQNLALMLFGLSNALQSYNAGKSTTSTFGTYSDTYGSGSFTAYSTTYDYSKQREIEEKNREKLIQASQQMELNNRAIEGGLLKANTLFPDQFVAGKVMIEIDQFYLNKILIEVPVGEDLHRFVYEPKRK